MGTTLVSTLIERASLLEVPKGKRAGTESKVSSSESDRYLDINSKLVGVNFNPITSSSDDDDDDSLNKEQFAELADVIRGSLRIHTSVHVPFLFPP